MDPLSIVGSIAGLLSLSGAVISAGYTLATRLKSNADEVKALTNEVAAVTGILQGVESNLRNGPATLPAGVADIPRVLEECESTLVGIRTLLDRMGAANKVALVLKGQGREERLAMYTRRIEHYKTYFILFFQLENNAHADVVRRRMSEILLNLEALRKGQLRIERATDILVEAENLRSRDKILSWLGNATETEHADLCNMRDSESASWILKREEFQSWLSSDGSSFFWLTGTQGSGKSIVVSKIIETIQETSATSGRRSTPTATGLAYHYCRFSNKDSLSPPKLLGAFVTQLVRQCEDSNVALPALKKLYEKHERRSSFPSFLELQELFFNLPQAIPRIFLVVDGLDEMPDRDDILDFLETLSARDGNFKVLVASRAEFDLRTAFSYYCHYTIQQSDIKEDIARFIRKRIQRMRLRRTEQDDIVRELVKNADGMFLWVVCQVEHLRQVRTAITPGMLRALPKSLEKTFEQTFTKLDDENQAIAKRILRFIMYSDRHMELAELIEGIAVTSHARSLQDVQLNKLRHESDIWEICGSLIRKSQSTGRIKLSHYSVYEFLRSSTLKSGRKNEFYLSQADSVEPIMTACIKYLDMDDVWASIQMTNSPEVGEGDRNHSFAFLDTTPYLDYAARHWWLHVSQASEEQIDQLWQVVVRPFLSSPAHFNSWARIAQHFAGTYKYPDGTSPLHVSAQHGLNTLAAKILQDTSTPRLSSSWPVFTSDGRSPLHVAIENGHDDMVSTFLANRETRTLEATDMEDRTPLRVAIEAGSEVAVARLVEAGANVNTASAKDHRTPVAIAIENSWNELAPLLSTKASPSRVLSDGRTLLHLAAQTGSTVWTRSLLAFHEELLDMLDVNGWTPLHFAANNGHEEVVEELLGRGAVRAVEDKKSLWTPLHSAIRHRHLGCARRLLLSSNALNMYEKSGRGVWRPSRTEMDPEERRMMVDKYGQITAMGMRSETEPPTPLLLAVSSNYVEGFMLLVDHSTSYGKSRVGLDDLDRCVQACVPQINAESGTSGSGPSTAGSGLEIFDHLLQLLRGFESPAALDIPTAVRALAHMSALDSGSGMELLRQRWDSEFVYKQLLLQAIRSSSVPGLTFLLDTWPPSAHLLPKMALHEMARSWRADEMRFVARLIDAGASTSHASLQRSAVEDGIRAGNWKVVEYLISRGVMDFSSKPNPLFTLVDWAGEDDADIARQLNVARQLLERGVSLNELDQNGAGICAKAASREDNHMLKWALEHGACAHVLDNLGETAVLRAIQARNVLNLQLLLNNIDARAPHMMPRVLWAAKSPVVMAVDQGDLASLESLLDADHATWPKDGWADDDLRDARQRAVGDALALAIGKQGLFADGLRLLAGHAPGAAGWAGRSGDAPLHIAVRKGDLAVAMMLLDMGADAGAETASGETARGLAVDKGRDDIVDLLQSYRRRPL